jgi:hypothetical protein
LVAAGRISQSELASRTAGDNTKFFDHLRGLAAQRQ